MKVLEKGRPQAGWSVETTCTGAGNGNGGCHAKLLVEQGDLYKTESSARDETTTYTTFTCAECGVETDLPSHMIPGRVQSLLPKKSAHPIYRDQKDKGLR